ncbi:MAG: acetoacetyl-CoA synthetase [Candidatus Azotimanducaceae bacterium]
MKPLWQPSEERIANSQMTRFQHFVERRYKKSFQNYQELHYWSITETDDFWSAIWEFCDLKATKPYEQPTLNLNKFPGTRWFSGSELNFAENLMRFRDDQVAMIGLLENGQRCSYTYAELWQEVEQLASAMRRHGVLKGDRIAGLMPNIPETVITMLATTSIGAIWSSCSPDFGINGACDRFSQIEPRLLFATDAYIYNGEVIDCLAKAASIADNIDSIEATIVIPLLTTEASKTDERDNTQTLSAFIKGDITPLTFAPLPFDHPLYIMYSSGTTGIPKCIVHGAGGTLIQHLKEHRLHTDITRTDTLFYFTTCGWMMWNWLVSGLSTGCTLVLYDGSPFAENGEVLLNAIDDQAITVFGTSAKYIASLEKQGLKPKENHHLTSLKTILSTGSPLSEASYEYIYRDFKADVCLSSISGGTDIVSCFMLGNPNLPVYSGEIQCRGLGMAIEFWNEDGLPEAGETGELVCIKPFPSTPTGFWHDQQDVRFLNAYFTQNPGVWTHGDYGELTEQGGVVIQGRSDAVLNPAGVRIGTAEIYRQVETIAAVTDSIAVGQEWQDDERVVLFVVLQPGISLDETLIETIKLTIRRNTTPRHVPAKVLQVADIPRTVSGKIVELAVRKIVHGQPVENTDALANPEALDFFKNRTELQY